MKKEEGISSQISGRYGLGNTLQEVEHRDGRALGSTPPMEQRLPPRVREWSAVRLCSHFDLGSHPTSIADQLGPGVGGVYEPQLLICKMETGRPYPGLLLTTGERLSARPQNQAAHLENARQMIPVTTVILLLHTETSLKKISLKMRRTSLVVQW